MTVGTTPRGEDDAMSAEPDDQAVGAQDQADDKSGGMGLLTEGVPLALLADLANPEGPASPTILEDEGLPDVAWWGDAEDADAARPEGEADGSEDVAAQ